MSQGWATESSYHPRVYNIYLVTRFSSHFKYYQQSTITTSLYNLQNYNQIVTMEKTAKTPTTPKTRLPTASPHSSTNIRGASPTPTISPRVLKKIKTDRYEKDIRPYFNAAQENKRRFLKVSAAGDEKIEVASKKYKDDKDELSTIKSRENRKTISAYIAAQESILESVNQGIKVLVSEFAGGGRLRTKNSSD
jgi:hypothetical protein